MLRDGITLGLAVFPVIPGVGAFASSAQQRDVRVNRIEIGQGVHTALPLIHGGETGESQSSGLDNDKLPLDLDRHVIGP